MFEYTDHKQVESSALTDLYYNEDERKVAVVTKDGHVYVYADVPKGVFNYFVSAVSVGNYYAKTIKKYYGPGTHLGHVASAVLVKAGEKAAVGTPKGLTYANDAEVDGKPVSASNGSPHVNFYTLGDSTAGQIVSTTTTNTAFSVRRHEVVFIIEGLEGERTTSVSGTSLNDAVENVKSSLRAFGLTIKVVRVVTHFE